jgi:O-antigen/teichoic acid export membrane protein
MLPVTSRFWSPRLAGNALWLGLAGLIEYGLQVILPIVLVRELTIQEFGDYRAVWLLIATVIAVAPFYLPQVLFYFIPRSRPDEAASHIASASLVLNLAGLMTALMVYCFREHLSHVLPPTLDHPVIVLAFLAAWVPAALLDTLANAQGKPRIQALITIAIAALRTILIGGAAVAFDGANPVFFAMLGLALCKLATLPLINVNTIAWCKTSITVIREQLSYAAPFAIANALFLLRLQIDQWIVITRFSTTVFAAFSIAVVAVSFSNLVRQPIVNAFMPAISSLLGQGRRHEATELIRRSFACLGLSLAPFVGLLLVIAPELVSLVYTTRYAEAAPIMQLYLLGQLATIFGGGHLLVVVGLGGEAVRISAAALLAAITVGYLGATWLGPLGAALGSVSGLLVGEILALRRAARALSIPVRSLANVEAASRALLSALISVASALAILMAVFPGAGSVTRIFVGAAIYVFVLCVCGTLVGVHSVVRDMWKTLHSKTGEDNENP